jgi:hypothetical protein
MSLPSVVFFVMMQRLCQGGRVLPRTKSRRSERLVSLLLSLQQKLVLKCLKFSGSVEWYSRGTFETSFLCLCCSSNQFVGRAMLLAAKQKNYSCYFLLFFLILVRRWPVHLLAAFPCAYFNRGRAELMWIPMLLSNFIIL